MKKLKRLFNKITTSPLGFSLFVNIVTLAVAMFGFRPYFETNDDLGMCLIGEGAYGARELHMIHPNYLLSGAVVFLQNLVPTIRWFMVLQYLFVFIALCVLVFILCRYKNGRLFSIILLLGVFYEVYVSVQYTKTATIVITAGFLCILTLLREELLPSEFCEKPLDKKGTVIVRTLAYLLITYASLLRREAIIIGLVPVGIVGLIDFIFCVKDAKKWSAVFIKYLTHVAPIFVTIMIFVGVDSAIYNSDPEWNYYRFYNDVCTQLRDYNYTVLDYSKYGEELSNIGISENDALMYLTWQFSDDSVLTTELMEQIMTLSRGLHINLELIKAWMANIYADVFSFSSTVIGLLAIISITLLKTKKKTKALWLIMTDACAMFALMFYYQYSGRWNHRVVYALFITFFATMLFGVATDADAFEVDRAINEKKEENTEEPSRFGLGMVISLMLVAIVSARLGNEFEYQEYLRSEQNFDTLRMYMEEEKDKLFIADTFTVQTRYRYDVFFAIPEGSLDNFVTTGSYLTGSPIEKDILKRYGYYNPFDALKKGGDNVILIDNCYPNQKAVFLSEHGDGPRYVTEFIERAFGYNMYHIR